MHKHTAGYLVSIRGLTECSQVLTLKPIYLPITFVSSTITTAFSPLHPSIARYHQGILLWLLTQRDTYNYKHKHTHTIMTLQVHFRRISNLTCAWTPIWRHAGTRLTNLSHLSLSFSHTHTFALSHQHSQCSSEMTSAEVSDRAERGRLALLSLQGQTSGPSPVSLTPVWLG